MLCLAKVKFDLRDPDELYFSQREIDKLLGIKTKSVRTIASLTKERRFNLLDDEVIHLINRLVYLGEGQGFLAEMPVREMINTIKRATFFREIYVIFESSNNEVLSWLTKIGVPISSEQLENRVIEPNPYTQIFFKRFRKRKQISSD